MLLFGRSKCRHQATLQRQQTQMPWHLSLSGSLARGASNLEFRPTLHQNLQLPV